MKVFTVVGARPQFIKAAPVSAALSKVGLDEYLVHTGQHYDPSMSEIFFSELGMAAPHENLGVGSGPHGEQTGRMLALLEVSMLKQKPGLVLVYGDTNSTLAGALAACKLGIPVAHVEAGLRSFNRSMPEEHNRVVTDHCSDLLFAPTEAATENLRREGIVLGVEQVGDVMFDAALRFCDLAVEKSTIVERLGFDDGEFYLATIHRAGNTDDPRRLAALFAALETLPLPTVLPLHPRTRARLVDGGVSPAVRIIDPVGYLDMLRLVGAATGIITDSGGVQKEAFFLGVPCFTLRSETEWVETVASGWNTLVPDRPGALADCVSAWRTPSARPDFYGDGDASGRIARSLAARLGRETST
ncbi:MAG: non-hydrolyzing UDP-N-acetylglucosamine 2-epimerase [Gemmatimonadota bacterium]